MANKIKIYSTLKSGKVFFDGARVNSKEIGTLEVEAHPSISNRIRIKSLTQFKRGSSTQYRVFFGKLNINRIQNEAGQNLVSDLGMDRDAVIAYISTQITKPIITEYFEYNPITDRLEANKNIEVNKHGFYVGGKYKMASGNSNLYFEDLANKANSYPVMGEVLDQSQPENQVAGAGFVTPKMRVFGDFQSIPLGGAPVNDTAIDYDGLNFFPFNISGVGITTRVAETVLSTQQLKYEITIDDVSVYIQYLSHSGFVANDDLTWYFDHPLDIESGTTLRATIYKVSTVNNQEQIDGILSVCEGDASPTRYQTNVMNRFFDDRDLELISPYIKYQAMDFGLDATGSTIFLRDLSLGADSLLVPHAVNTLEAVADGTTIKIKLKGGAKVIVESLPVSGASIDGSFVNSVLNQAVTQLNALFTNTAGFASSADSFTNSFVLSGTDLTIGLNDGTSYTVDVTSLGVSTDNFVVSGLVSGSDIILTMDDASEITIDATNMINGSSTFANGADWYMSYGTYANENVNSTTSHLDNSRTPPSIGGRAPFYFGTSLERGTEFRWNNNANTSHLLGIWDGTEAEAGTYNSRVPSNWSTAFNYHVTGFQASSNVSLTNTTATNRYTPSFGAPLSIRFLSDGHITLNDLSGATEVEIAKTNNPLVDTSFQLQLGCDANFVFPQFVVQDTTNTWEIVHDYNGTESGILNGILDHTVLKSGVSIEKGEKIMFMLDEVGQGDYFGTNYTAAGTGVGTAEEQLDNEFKYETNEALSFEFSGVSDWDVNTNATYYFNNGAGVVGYRDGGAGSIQGMFSLRFNSEGKLTIYSEDNNEKVATAKIDPQVGSSVHFYMGVRGNRAYYSIPVISKQTIGGGSQPDSNYVPTVADQTTTVQEGGTLNYQIISSDNIVNQFVEVDAPSWMYLDQASGILSGTAPAFLGTSADTIVVNCKAGNAIGGTVDFTVTVSISEIAYTNSKSLQFDGSSSWLQGNATLMDSMDRATNGDGNAWSISMWVKPHSNTAVQTLFVYGAGDDYNGGTVTLKKVNANNLTLLYGTVYNNIITFATAFNANTWSHILVTFDGGTTGDVGADLSDYYSRFKVYVDGSLASVINANSNVGYIDDISGEDVSDNILRFGRASNVHNNYFDGLMNSMAIWSSDEGANISDIYNGGTLHNLSDLTNAPDHYYEIESSTTTVADIEGNAPLTGYNFASSDLVTDTP